MMHEAAAIVCKVLMQKVPSPRRESLLKFLPEKQQHMIQALPSAFKDPIDEIEGIEDQLQRIHYSWFAPFLRMLPENEIRLFLSCLSERQVKGLKKLLLFSNHLLPLTSVAKQFLQQRALENLKADQKELLPIACLPAAPLNILLSLSVQEYEWLIECLAMHDLASEIRQIIDTAKLKKIYNALSKEELQYLKTLMQHKEPITFKRISLEHWDGQPQTLRSILHQRGINRFAKALYGQHASLIWHVSHHMEMSMAMSLLHLCTKLEHPRAAAILSTQVLDAMTYIQTLKK